MKYWMLEVASAFTENRRGHSLLSVVSAVLFDENEKLIYDLGQELAKAKKKAKRKRKKPESSDARSCQIVLNAFCDRYKLSLVGCYSSEFREKNGRNFVRVFFLKRE
ncbi:MAG: hypothetical protein Q8Q97_01245 [bacterium]|nr:hypothetical protein [bacterium]